jgi:hypothetical protein
MTNGENAPKTKRDVIQAVLNNFDPRKVLAELERERPSFDGQIKEITQAMCGTLENSISEEASVNG